MSMWVDILDLSLYPYTHHLFLRYVHLHLTSHT